jgi:catechol 2,3-dioxygenase-like lactoylglutathione lyase family enzyme
MESSSTSPRPQGLPPGTTEAQRRRARCQGGVPGLARTVQLPQVDRTHRSDQPGVIDPATAYSGFAVDDLAAAAAFYRQTLGLTVTDEHGLLDLTIGPGARVLVYPKPDHVPAAHTVLNFPVDDIDAAVDALAARGVRLLRFDTVAADDKGISRGAGPHIAWFTDPAGNVLSVLQETPPGTMPG